MAKAKQNEQGAVDDAERENMKARLDRYGPHGGRQHRLTGEGSHGGQQAASSRRSKSKPDPQGAYDEAEEANMAQRAEMLADRGHSRDSHERTREQRDRVEEARSFARETAEKRSSTSSAKKSSAKSSTKKSSAKQK